ncbi:hypothetical protein, conserved [Eimeria acervulina]|uniref:Uncharacterized protein n=1 Tax=Eimeria acervulina TaxID=5801 RepID=U6GRR6_EIMAC|nr:hypothetical protein, conserved [Eimeria acervulina]CDI81943.1 hypothetical protein, conserved [Eimeria acervulina]
MYSISRTVSILPHAFRMYCVLTYKAIDFSKRRGPLQLYLQCVLWESDCFGLRNHHHFFDFYSNPTNVCLKFKEIAENRMEDVMDDILDNYRYLLCVRFVPPDAMVYTAGVAIAFALGYLILTGFEVLVWLLYRSTERWLPILVSTIGIGFFVLWIGSLFIPQLFTFFGCWISFVMVLTLPWILWLALAAAYNLRKLQHQKWALWQEQANRPLAQLVDRGRRGSDPFLEKRVLVPRRLLLFTYAFWFADTLWHVRIALSTLAFASTGERGLGGQGSGDGLGVLDLDVDMEDVAALKASEICEEGPAEKTKKKNDSHFELTNLKETLQGTLGLRQKKDNSHQQLGGNRSQPPSQHHASSPVTVENSTNSQDKASSNKPQPLSDAAKTD